MTERLRSASSSNVHYKPKKMGDDLGPGKTLVILVIVVGCFAVLCPNVFYPMLFGSSQNHIKPSPIDKTTGCCDVISEIDINTLRIMSELCRTIIRKDSYVEVTAGEIISQCQKAVLETCGIDISAVLQERIILGHTTKQILDEIRSLNGSLCLKYNFGVSPWRLGVPHRVTVNIASSPTIKQERPSHLRSEMVHPAFRERGRAIPTQQPSPSRPPPRMVEGKPGPIPGMRPTIGGAGKVVPPPKQTTGTMGVIMPIYTIGIVILFTYTVMKVLFKKQQESLYPPVEPDPVFRREVFEQNRGHSSAYTRESPSNKLVVNAMTALLDQVDKELAARLQTSDINEEDVTANGNIIIQEDQGSVKVLGMEMTASCEGNKKWSRSDSPALPSSPPTSHPTQTQSPDPPQEIYLEGSLPPQSNHLLVADSATEAQKINTEEDPAVVLAGKMTLSVLSLDSENGNGEFDKKTEDRSSSNVSEDFEKIDSGDILGDHLNEGSQLDDLNESVYKTDDTVGTHELLQKKVSNIDSKTFIESNEITNTDDIIKSQQLVLNDPTQAHLIKEDIAQNEGTQIFANQESVETKLSPDILEFELDNIEYSQMIILSGSIQKDNTSNANIVQIHNEPKHVVVEECSERNLNSVYESGIKNPNPELNETKEIKVEEVLDKNKNTNNSQEVYDEQQKVDIGLNETTNFVAEEVCSTDSNFIILQTSIDPLEHSIQNTEKLGQELDEIIQLDEVDTVKEVLGEISTRSVQPIEFQSQKEIKNFPETSLPMNEAIKISEHSEVTETDKSPADTAKDECGLEHNYDLDKQKETEFSTIKIIKNEDSENTQSSTAVTSTVDNNIEQKNLGDSSTEFFDDSTLPLPTASNLDENTKGLSSVSATNLAANEENICQSDESTDGEEVEYEYEYEIGEEEEMDEEIQNIDRLTDMEEEISPTLNGADHEEVKNGTTSNDTLAENIISDEEILNDDEEIIEYVTDEEEIIEEPNQPQNGINDLSHNTTGAN